MYKSFFGKKKETLRSFSWILAVIMFVTSIPGQAFVAKAEVRSDWETVQQSFSYIQDAAFGNERFLVMERDGTICSSEDGSGWEDVGKISLNDTSLVYGLHMAYCGKYFYIYGVEGYLYSSEDGIEWKCIDIGDKKINCITYAEGKYYALTGKAEVACEYFFSAADASLMYSEDGFDWKVINDNIPQTEYAGIAYGNGILAGVSKYSDNDTLTLDMQGNVLSTFEVEYGEQWDNCQDIHYINGVFLLLHRKGVYISENAKNWYLLKECNPIDAMVIDGDYYTLKSNGDLLHFPNVSMGNRTCNELKAGKSMTLYSFFGGKGLLFAQGYNQLWNRNYRYEEVSDNTVSDNVVSGNETDEKWEKLTKNTTIHGDYDVTDKKLDLNGYTLTVNGTLTCADTEIRTSGGQLCAKVNVVIEDKTQVEGVLNIEGDLKANGGYLSFLHAQINVGGNVEVTNNAYNYGFSMLNEDDMLIVNGDFAYHAPYEMGKTQGKIAIAGDIDITGNFTQGADQVLCLNGNQKQTITILEKTEFGFVQAQNTSVEGIFVNRILNANGFESNSGKFNYGDGNTEGILGYTLTEDQIIEGDLYLMDGILDLNGHSLYVKGDLLQASGTLLVNGGSLTVENDYRLQYRTGSEEYTYDCGKGILQMTNANDSVWIKGDFYVHSNVSMEGYLSEGTLILEGDITQTGENIFVATGNHKVIFEQKSNSGETTHKISMDEGSRFHIIQLEQAEKYEIEKDLQEIADEVVYGDSIMIPEAPVLEVTEVSSKTISLKWTPVEGENITYQVYRSQQYVNDEIYELIAEGLTDTTYDDQNTGNRQCSYKVAAVNSMNLKSEYSNTQTTHCNNLYFYNINPIVKSTVGGESTQFQIRLSGSSRTENKATISYLTEDGENYEVLSEYVISKEQLENNFSNSITMSVPWSTFSGDQELTLKFEISDRDGIVNTRTYKYVLDLTTPEMPTNLGVRESYGDAYLTWTKSASSDCSGYKVFRKEKNGSYELIGTATGSYYKDQTIVAETEYAYYIVAFDVAGNESSATDEVIIKLEADVTSPQVRISSPASEDSINASQQIYVSATDNRKLSSIKVYLINKNGKKTLLTEQSTNSYTQNVNFTWDTTAYEDGEYLISAIVEDKAGNKSEEVTVTCIVDNTPPEKVTGVECVPADTSIQVMWNELSEEIYCYTIEWFAVGEENSKRTLNTYDTNVYTIQDLKPETEYVISVYAEDELRNKGKSTEVVVTTLKDMEAPVITSISPESAYSINRWTSTVYLYLYAQDNVALSDAVFSYSTDGKNYHEILRDTGDGYKTQSYSATWDVSELTDGAVTLLIQVYDVYGNCVSEKKEYIVDRIAPEVPKNFVAESPEHAICLSWETDDTDIQYYYLTRRNKNSGAEYASFKVTENTFVDSEVTLGEVYTYTLYAVDKSNNSGNSTETLMILAGPEPDTTPPGQITDLYCTKQSGSSITLEWSQVTDNIAVDHYNVYRDGELIATVKDDSYTDCDEVLDKNVTYNYYVTAEDEAGNVSKLSNEAEGKLAPPQIINVSPENKAEFGGEKVTLGICYRDGEYESDKYVNISYYDAEAMEQIYLARNLKSSNKLTNSSVYFDWDMTRLQSGSYTVRYELYDMDGNTDTKEVIYVIDRTLPYAPQAIRYSEENGVVNLSWSPSDSDDCEGYYVLRRKANEQNYEVLEKISVSRECIFSDTSAVSGETYYYAVQAYDKYLQLSEYSKEIKVIVSADEEAPVIQNFAQSNSKISGMASLDVTASDNRKLSVAKFYIINGEAEEIIDTVSFTKDEVCGKWDTTKYKDGLYIVKVLVEDEAGNCSEPLRYLYQVDNTGVSAVPITDYYVYDSKVILIWDNPKETDCAGFYVEQLVNGTYIRRGNLITALNTTVEGLTPDTEYTFRIVAIDDVGNWGEVTEGATIKTTSDTTAPWITEIDINELSTADTIHLSCRAEDNSGIDYVRLSYTRDGEAYTEIYKNSYNVSKKATVKYSWDVSALSEGTITVKYEVVDVNGNANAESTEITYKIDRTPPKSVENVVIKDTNGSVSLAWDGLEEDDTFTYDVFRKEVGGDYVCIAGGISSTTYTDRYVECEESYTYKICAVDMAGNVGEFSEEVTATVGVDTQKPRIYGMRSLEGYSYEVGSNPRLAIYVMDNADLDKMMVSYRKSGQEEWIEENELTVEGKVATLLLDWNTEGLEDGEYEFCCVAEDVAGNISQTYSTNFTLDNHAPEIPVVETEGDYNAIILNTQICADTYGLKLFRRAKGETIFEQVKEFTYPQFTDAGLEIKKEYEYQVVAYDKVGNESSTAVFAEETTGVDVTSPVCLIGDYMNGRLEREVRFDALMCEDNAGIVSYYWDFGDGTYSKKAVATHIYEESGDYTYSLTIKDAAGNTSTKSGNITVKEKGMVMPIRIVDTQGNAVPGVSVVVNSDDAYVFTTDQEGYAYVVTEDTELDVHVYKDGCGMTEQKLTVGEDGETDSVVFKSATKVTGNLTYHEMSYDEMVAAGIDFGNEENCSAVQFELTLKFGKRDIPVTVCNYLVKKKKGNYVFGFGGGASTIGGSVTNRDGTTTNYELQAIETTQGPAIVCMTQSETVSCLNNMYCMELTIINEGESEIENARASIRYDEGVKLAATLSPQSETVEMGNISAGSNATASWIVCAEKSGTYNVYADFTSGNDSGEDVKPYTFKKTCTFKCEGMSGLRLYIRPEKNAYIGENYYIQYELKNESSHDMYAVQTTFGKYQTETAKFVTVIQENGETVKEISTGGEIKYELPDSDTSVVTTDGDTVGIDVLPKGKSIKGTHVRTFSASDDADEDYYELLTYVADITGDDDKGLKIVVIPSGGHVKKTVINRIVPEEPEEDEEDDEDNETEFGGGSDRYGPSLPVKPNGPGTTIKDADPINLMTGGFESENRLMTVAGVRNLIFGIRYDSTDTDAEGDMGYGWYHTWESSVERQGQNVILHDKPGSDIVFTSENAMNHVVFGSYNAENGVVTVSANELPSEEYLPVSNAMEGYRIHRNADGYQLLMPDGSENGYDTNGRLIYSKNSLGQTICISYRANTMTITDEATDKSIVCTYSGEHLVSLTDPNGENASFTYDANGNLSSVTSKRGTSNTYVYDDAHRIIEGYDTTGTLFVKNTYDEKGRVLTQDDNDETTPLLTLSYVESEENHTTQIFYTKTNGGEEVIIANTNGHGISYTDSVGGTRTYTYNYDGELIAYRDEDGTGCDYVRDDEGRIVTQTDTKGNVQTYIYDERGNLLFRQSSSGTSWAWTYNAQNQVIKSRENGITKTYTYNEDGQMITCITEGSGTVTYAYENGNVAKITYPNEKSDKFYYDNVGNVVKYENTNDCVTEYKVDAGGNVLRESVYMEDGTCVTTSATYDAYGKPLSVTDAEGNVTSYIYNSHDMLESETKADGSKTTFAYDEDGNMTSITYPDGTTTQTAVYDTAGNLKQIINTLKQTTTAEYNSASQLIKATQADGGVVTYKYYDNGLLKSQTDAEGNTTSYVYDEAGRICIMTDPKGNTVTITYDTYGNMNTITDGEGNTVTLTYNGFGEITSTVDANGNRTSFAYDSMGNCVSMTDALGNVTEYTYDAAGQITAVTQKGKDGEDITISYAYDNLGNITSVTDGEGNTFRMTYDKVGNVTAIYDAYGQLAESYTYDSVYNQTSVTDGNGATMLYSYDRMGNKIKTLNESNGSVTTYSYIGGSLINASTDALGGITSATYDAMGNLESFTNPNGGVTTYTYDKNQNVTSESVGDYYKVTYTYDAAGNVKTMTNSRGQTTTYEYDKAGRVIKQSDEAGTITYTYDANGNKLKVTETVSANSLEENVSANTITRTYDKLNRVKTYTDAEGNTIIYDYDEFGNITSVTYPGGQGVAYTYDKNGNVLTMTDWNDRQTSYDYDKNGRLVKTQRPDGSTETRTYDKAGNLVAIKDIKKEGTVINDYTYNYDKNGNITVITDQSAAKSSQQTTTDSVVQMEYDEVNRLIKYNGKEVRYDADGNMIYGPLDGEMATFKYDCRNRLTQVTTDSGETTQYAYNAENVRTKVIKNAGTEKETVTTYVTDSVSHELSRVLQATTTDKDGNTETILYTYGNGLIAQEKVTGNGEKQWNDIDASSEYLIYHFNHLGSTTAVTNEAGEIKYTYTYNIFGKLLRGSYGEVEFMYNGQYGVASDANGLYYMRARYYNIDIMRFINQDILTGSIDSSQSLNRYAYVEGNPVNFLDPFGLDETKSDTGKLIDYVMILIGVVMWYFGLDQGTTGIGLQGNISPGIFDINGQFGGSIDKNGDFILQYSAGFSVTIGSPGGSIGPYFSKSNADSVDDLEGDGYNFGGDFSYFVGLGVDFNIIPTEQRTYYGITVSPSSGTEMDFHVGYSYTTNIYEVKGNIYEIVKKYITKIMEG